MNNDLYVLDSCALIAFFRKEIGAEIVAKIFERAAENECTVYMHKASIAEVYYDTLRFSGKEEAENIFKILITLPVDFTNNLNNTFIKKVGYFKVNHKISFADCFVLALASIKKAIVISSDHHEFDEIEKTKILSFRWIR
jgi:predicted nucleic acid-binding protein